MQEIEALNLKLVLLIRPNAVEARPTDPEGGWRLMERLPPRHCLVRFAIATCWRLPPKPENGYELAPRPGWRPMSPGMAADVSFNK
jgi:hypothetical protein